LTRDVLELLVVTPGLVVGLFLFQLLEERIFLTVDDAKINAVV
jgi:hypothetical protein